MIEKTAIQCDSCVKADVCGKKQEFKSVIKAADKLCISVDDCTVMDVRDISWVAVIVRCNKFVDKIWVCREVTRND